jgi:hypothetical protein
MGGRPRKYVASVDEATGTVTAWDPNADNWVDALVVSGKVVYAGGYFSTIGGHARPYVAALDAETGAATSWNSGLTWTDLISYVGGLALGGTTLYVGGNFHVDRPPLLNNLIACDARSGRILDWAPRADFRVNALTVSATSTYSGGDFKLYSTRFNSFLAFPLCTDGLQGFTLLVPEDADSVETSHPTLIWNGAQSSNTGRKVRYTVYWSESPDFAPADSGGAGFDTTYTFASGPLRVHHTYHWRVRAFDQNGRECWSSPDGGASFYVREEGSPDSPLTSPWLCVNPNPGKENANIVFHLPIGGDVTLRAFDVAGREVTRKLWKGVNAGTYVRTWEARDDTGRLLPPGAYWLQLQTAVGVKTSRWTLVR